MTVLINFCWKCMQILCEQKKWPTGRRKIFTLYVQLYLHEPAPSLFMFLPHFSNWPLFRLIPCYLTSRQSCSKLTQAAIYLSEEHQLVHCTRAKNVRILSVRSSLDTFISKIFINFILLSKCIVYSVTLLTQKILNIYNAEE